MPAPSSALARTASRPRSSPIPRMRPTGSPAWTRHRVDLLVLAGYLKLVPAAVIARYRHRIVNIHPALLPAFGGRGMYGRRVHEAVPRSGARRVGATVHLVDEVYDRGAILAQRRVPVLPGDTPERLAARVLEVEHRLLPAVVRAAAARRAAPCPFPTPWSPRRDRPVMPRALISVSDKRGIVAFAQGLVELGWEIVSTGGTAAALRTAGDVGHDGRRGHRLSRAARWPGQDAAPGDPRRAAGAARPPGAPGRGAGARHRADRPRGGQPLPVPDDDLAGPAWRSTTRSRTSTSAARRCCARRPRTTSSCCRSSIRPTIPRCSICSGGTRSRRPSRREFAAKVFAHTADYDAAIAGYLTPQEEGLPRRLGIAMERGQSPALRRESRPARRALRDRGAARHARPHPAAGQGAVLQQPARHRRRHVGGGELEQPAGLLRSSSTPRRAASRWRARPSRHSARPARPTRSPPSAR